MTKENITNNHLHLDMITNVFMCASVLGVYIVGLYLHTKIITVSRKDKSMTWKMDIMNSILISFHFAHVLAMDRITYLINDLHVYTGTWFCYTSKAITFLGNSHVTQHSLIIALDKFVMIVLNERVRVIGKGWIQKVFLWVNAIFPVYLLSFFSVMRPDFIFVYDGISHANRCLGKSDLVSSQNTNQTAVKLHNICEFEEPDPQMSSDYFAYLGKKIICWSHIVLVYFNAWNILEVVVYCVIFIHMHRYNFTIFYFSLILLNHQYQNFL